MATPVDLNVDTSKLSEENVRNYKKQEEKGDGKKWVS
jgi:hypothetical protein